MLLKVRKLRLVLLVGDDVGVEGLVEERLEHAGVLGVLELDEGPERPDRRADPLLPSNELGELGDALSKVHEAVGLRLVELLDPAATLCGMLLGGVQLVPDGIEGPLQPFVLGLGLGTIVPCAASLDGDLVLLVFKLGDLFRDGVALRVGSALELGLLLSYGRRECLNGLIQTLQVVRGGAVGSLKDGGVSGFLPSLF